MLRELALLAALAGCSHDPSQARRLPAEWAPLTMVVRAPTVPEGRVQTRAPLAFVADPDEFMDRLDPGERDAVLAHERTHARRQLAFGVNAWIVAYNQDVRFRRDEELLGWSDQIAYHKAHGRTPSPWFVANSLVTYSPTLGLSYPEALSWALQEVGK